MLSYNIHRKYEMPKPVLNKQRNVNLRLLLGYVSLVSCGALRHLHYHYHCNYITTVTVIHINMWPDFLDIIYKKEK